MRCGTAYQSSGLAQQPPRRQRTALCYTSMYVLPSLQPFLRAHWYVCVALQRDLGDVRLVGSSHVIALSNSGSFNMSHIVNSP